jgi:hypothetical protein
MRYNPKRGKGEGHADVKGLERLLDKIALDPCCGRGGVKPLVSSHLQGLSNSPQMVTTECFNALGMMGSMHTML